MISLSGLNTGKEGSPANDDSKKETFAPFDIAEHLETEEEITAFLEILLAEGSPKEIASGIGYVARAKGMTQIARDAGVSRESLYRALSSDGNPEFSTIIKVIRALGMKLVPVPVPLIPETP